MKDRRRYAFPTNLLEAVAACGVSIFGIIALLPATGAAPGPEMGIFILLMLCCVLMLAAAVCMAGYLVVDERGCGSTNCGRAWNFPGRRCAASAALPI